MAALPIAAAAATLPKGNRFVVLVKGPDAYVSVRPGSAVSLACSDATLEATAETVTIGPLLSFLGGNMLGMPQHHANPNGQDARSIVDYLEAAAPKDRAAIDPRTIYSAVTVTIPAPMPAPLAA